MDCETAGFRIRDGFLSWSSRLGGKSQRMSPQELRCPFRIATFERLEDRFVELRHLHHIEFLGSKEDSGSNLEPEPIPGAEKKGILGAFND